MYLESLYTRGFRALPDQRFSLPQAGLRLSGGNGSGKTTILEAIAYLSSGRSNRGASDHHVARHGSSSFDVAGRVVRADDISSDISVRWRPGTKRVDIDGQRLPRLSQMVGLLPLVHFDANDIALVRAGPHARRAFLDLTLATLSRSYLKTLLDYRLTLKRRNTILRGRSSTDLDIWTLQLATLGTKLTRERALFLPDLELVSSAIHEQISQQEQTLSFQYRPSLADATVEAALARLRNAAHRDRSAGYTTVGPHRDDIALLLGHCPARHFSSLGQAKTIALSLVAARIELFTRALGHPPVVLLDDLSGDLDPQRVDGLSALVPTSAQVIVTDTTAAHLPDRFLALEERRLRANT